MDVLIIHVLQIPHEAGGPHVALLVPVALKLSVGDGHHHEHADVELTRVVEQRVGDVLLDDDGGWSFGHAAGGGCGPFRVLALHHSGSNVF